MSKADAIKKWPKPYAFEARAVPVSQPLTTDVPVSQPLTTPARDTSARRRMMPIVGAPAGVVGRAVRTAATSGPLRPPPVRAAATVGTGTRPAGLHTPGVTRTVSSGGVGYTARPGKIRSDPTPHGEFGPRSEADIARGKEISEERSKLAAPYGEAVIAPYLKKKQFVRAQTEVAGMVAPDGKTAKKTFTDVKRVLTRHIRQRDKATGVLEHFQNLDQLARRQHRAIMALKQDATQQQIVQLQQLENQRRHYASMMRAAERKAALMRQSVDVAMIALRGLTERDEKGKPTATAKEFAKTKQPRKPKKGEKRKRPKVANWSDAQKEYERDHAKRSKPSPPETETEAAPDPDPTTEAAEAAPELQLK